MPGFAPPLIPSLETTTPKIYRVTTCPRISREGFAASENLIGRARAGAYRNSPSQAARKPTTSSGDIDRTKVFLIRAPRREEVR